MHIVPCLDIGCCGYMSIEIQKLCGKWSIYNVNTIIIIIMQ
jgi:hypothetical protein